LEPGDLPHLTDAVDPRVIQETAMKFTDMTNEALAALRAEKDEALAALLEIEAGKATLAQAEEAETLDADIKAIDEVTAARKAEAEAPERLAALKAARVEAAGSSDEAGTEKGEDATGIEDPNANTVKGGNPDDEEGKVTTEESPGEGVPPGNVVDAEGNPTPLQQSSTVEALAAKSTRPQAPANQSKPVTIVASAGVDGFEAGQTIGLMDVAKGAIARARSFGTPAGDGKTVDLQKFGTASFTLDFPEDLVVDRSMSEERISEVMARAADETRLPGGSLAESANLTAAGGWCAPSETVYDLTQDATAEGMLSLPEIAVKRGGIRFAGSPTFSDFYANPGFIQTEAQAISGTVKPCVEVNCPSFTDVRLDVEGLCIKVPILTNAGYPEYVRNFVEGTLVAHQHWINANVIGRLVTAAGAAKVITGLGSTTTDTLAALEVMADRTRQKYRLSLNRTLEVVVPFWVRGAIRTDLSRRTGVDFEQVSDAQISGFFRARKLNVQFVYDWQDLPLVDVGGTAGFDESLVYPSTYNALMYPAGTFVKGTADVINLSTVYDAASLATNVYTGLFTEQGLLVAKQKFHADLLTLPVCNAGRTGSANLVCAAAAI
jgi:hypothetical protein